MTIRAGFGLVLLLAAPGAEAAQPPAGQQASQPAAGSSEAAQAALQSFDMGRLVRDRAYAEEILRDVDRLDAEGAQLNAQDRAGIRLLALAALGRREEAQAGIDRLVLAGPREVQPQVDAWWSALILDDSARAVAVLEGASRRVHGVDWPELRRRIGPDLPRAMFAHLTGEAARPLRVRLASALLGIGWPGDADRVAGDDLRRMVLDDRIARGDANGAAEVAATIRTPAALLPLILRRRYDSAIGADRDRLAMLRTALAEEDRETAAAVAVTRPDVDHLLARARYLRAVGRNAEAWALVEPMTRDVAATVSAGTSGIWLIDQAVGILSALDRKDEAVALYGRLVAVPLTVNPDLINVYINHIAFLSGQDLHAEALEQARRLERDDARQISAYGKMWVSSGIVCALAGLGRAGEAGPVLERMRATQADNLAAMIDAHLCLGDSAAAEALLIRRLEDPEIDMLAIDFQTFELDDDDPPPPESLAGRMRALRERPAVRAALDRVARTLRLPLAEYTWY